MRCRNCRCNAIGENFSRFDITPAIAAAVRKYGVTGTELAMSRCDCAIPRLALATFRRGANIARPLIACEYLPPLVIFGMRHQRDHQTTARER